MGANFVFNKQYVEIEEGVSLTGEVPRETSFEVGDRGDRFIIREVITLNIIVGSFYVPGSHRGLNLIGPDWGVGAGGIRGPDYAAEQRRGQSWGDKFLQI